MAAESAADRLAFLTADDFGTAATYTPAAGGAASQVKGIFDDGWLEFEGEGEASASGTAPRFVCRTADLSGGGAFGDTLVIGGVTHKARIIKPDGTGMTELWLEKQ